MKRTPEQVHIYAGTRKGGFTFTSDLKRKDWKISEPCHKGWEVNHLDTLELWKFGDYKSFTSLLLLATVLGVPTPKDDIDGSMVWDVYWNEKNLPRIVTYCQKDVLTIAQIFLRFRGEHLLSQNEVEIISNTMTMIQ